LLCVGKSRGDFCYESMRLEWKKGYIYGLRREKEIHRKMWDPAHIKKFSTGCPYSMLELQMLNVVVLIHLLLTSHMTLRLHNEPPPATH